MAYEVLAHCASLEHADVRTSNPEYNRTNVESWHASSIKHYAPRVFGLRIPTALGRLLNVPDVKIFMCAQGLKAHKLEFNTFVQGKVKEKGDASINFLRKSGMEDMASKLSVFKEAFLQVNGLSVKTLDEWNKWVDDLKIFPKSWQDNLEYEKFLAMFGMPQEQIAEWCKQFPDDKGIMTSTAHIHLRWFTKALTAFGFPMSLADVAAVVLAMVNWPAERKASEDDLVKAIDTLTQQCVEKKFDGLWVPDIHCLDGELDDRISLGLIGYVRFHSGLQPVKSMWQFPQEMEGFANVFHWNNSYIFVDPKAKNAPALTSQWIN